MDSKRIPILFVVLIAAVVTIVAAAPGRNSNALDSFLNDVGVSTTTDAVVPADLKANLNVVATVVDESTFTPESASDPTASRTPVDVNPRSPHVDPGIESARQFAELAQHIGQRSRQPALE